MGPCSFDLIRFDWSTAGKGKLLMSPDYAQAEMKRKKKKLHERAKVHNTGWELAWREACLIHMDEWLYLHFLVCERLKR